MATEPKTSNSEAEIRRSSQKIVYISAILVTVWAAFYFIGLAGKLIVDGTVHSVSAPPIQSISAVVGILLDISLLILFIVLRRLVQFHRQVYADLGMVFMALVCVTSCINWFVQLTIIPEVVKMGDSTLIALLDVHNTSSLMYALEHLGWGLFYGLATIFMAVTFGGNRPGLWIRWLLVSSGVLSLIHLIGIVVSNQSVADLGYIAWAILLPITSILLSTKFKPIS